MTTPQELASIPLLQDLGGSHAAEVARIARVQEFRTGAEIFRQGEESALIYFVLDGEVTLEVRVSPTEVAEVHRVGAGDLFGWSPVLGRSAMTATARAATPARLVLVDVRQILNLCERNPVFSRAFYRLVAQVVSSRLDDTHHRLAHHLPRRAIPSCPAEGSD